MRRFILLIDTLYFTHRNVIIEAQIDIEHLFMINEATEKQKRGAFDTELQQNDDFKFDEEFAYARCLSRLKEMQTKEYQLKMLNN